jgi:hypothetical protein
LNWRRGLRKSNANTLPPGKIVERIVADAERLLARYGPSI